MTILYTNVPLVYGDDDLVTTVYTAQKFPLHQYREEDGKGYRFVKFDNGSGNVASAANGVAYWLGTTVGTVTMDVSDADVNSVAGVFQAVIADAGYGWIQTRGLCTVATNGDDNIAAYDAIIGVGDGTCDSVAQDTAPTNKVLGWAHAADSDSANTVVAFLVLD
jgi:hypothetical protein